MLYRYNRQEVKPEILTVGRDRNSDFIIDDPSVSFSHAEIMLGPHGVLIRDVGSTNGTRLDQWQVDYGWHLVRPYNTLYLGTYRVRPTLLREWKLRLDKPADPRIAHLTAKLESIERLAQNMGAEEGERATARLRAREIRQKIARLQVNPKTFAQQLKSWEKRPPLYTIREAGTFYGHEPHASDPVGPAFFLMGKVEMHPLRGGIRPGKLEWYCAANVADKDCPYCVLYEEESAKDWEIDEYGDPDGPTDYCEVIRSGPIRSKRTDKDSHYILERT